MGAQAAAPRATPPSHPQCPPRCALIAALLVPTPYPTHPHPCPPPSLPPPTPPAAAIASALFVASNELAAVPSDPEQAATAELLASALRAAGCANYAAALSLLLGERRALVALAREQPAVWLELGDLISNDVHLCGFAGVMAPGPPPTLRAGGA